MVFSTVFHRSCINSNSSCPSLSFSGTVFLNDNIMSAESANVDKSGEKEGCDGDDGERNKRIGRFD